MSQLRVNGLHNGQLVWWVEPGLEPDCFVVDKKRKFTEMRLRIVGFDEKPSPEECFAAANGNDWKLWTSEELLATPYGTGVAETMPKMFAWYVSNYEYHTQVLVDVWHDEMPWAPITIRAEAFDPKSSNSRLFSNARSAIKWANSHVFDVKKMSLVDQSDDYVEMP